MNWPSPTAVAAAGTPDEPGQFMRAKIVALVNEHFDLRPGAFREYLHLHRGDIVHEARDLDAYLDLAGCEGPDRERAHALAPPDYEGVLGWFVLGR